MQAEKPMPDGLQHAVESKHAPKPKSTYKGAVKEKPSRNDWTYKSDAQEQATPKKPGFKGKSGEQAPKKPRFNGKKSR